MNYGFIKVQSILDFTKDIETYKSHLDIHVFTVKNASHFNEMDLQRIVYNKFMHHLNQGFSEYFILKKVQKLNPRINKYSLLYDIIYPTIYKYKNPYFSGMYKYSHVLDMPIYTAREMLLHGTIKFLEPVTKLQ